MSEKHQDKPLSYVYLNAQYQKLNAMTYEERIAELALNPDRADVIIPATRIYLKRNEMEWCKTNLCAKNWTFGRNCEGYVLW